MQSGKMFLMKNFILPAQHYDGEKFVDVWLDK